MKRYLSLGLVFVAVLFLMTGCVEKNIDGTLEEIMTKLYTDLAEDKTPMGLTNIELTDDNIENYIGTKEIDYTEAMASESMTGSIAHSVVLIRVEDVSKMEKYKEEILEKVNPRKWICVGIEKEEVIIENKGNLLMVLIVQDEDNRNIIAEAFNNL